MEKYSETCRIIAHCEEYSKVIGPLKSRFSNIRVPAPQYPEVKAVLQMIAKD